MSYSYCNNHYRQSSKRFCNFYKHFGHSIETCYYRNKSVILIFVAIVANIESVQPMALISTQSKSSGCTFIMFTDDLKNIITNVIRMVGNAFYSYSLSALSGMSPSS